MTENGYFKLGDKRSMRIMGYPIKPGWWSRKYEYPWAFQYAENWMTVADMGCGWTERPFKRALAKVCQKVYAVDGNEKAGMLPIEKNMEYIIADFTQEIMALPEKSLDAIFCISVLEDVGDKVSRALEEFWRLLKWGGMCVLTFDVQYDYEKPLGEYPCVVLDKFERDAIEIGFSYREPPILDRRDVVFNPELNLCVFHCVIEK